MKASNLFTGIPETLPEELCEPLLETAALRLERIVSAGHATAPGQWYDQERNEWVMLLRGSAGLRFEGEAQEIVLHPGDCILIPAHCRHRVEWTAPDAKTVWLALHCGNADEIGEGRDVKVER